MIPASIDQELRQLFAGYPEIEKVILFGSRARGDYNDRSDIDLMIQAPTLSKDAWLNLVFRIDENINTLLSIDVILWEEAPVSLRNRVQKEGKVIYERYQDTTKFSEFGESPATIKGSLGRNTHQ